MAFDHNDDQSLKGRSFSESTGSIQQQTADNFRQDNGKTPFGDPRPDAKLWEYRDPPGWMEHLQVKPVPNFEYRDPPEQIRKWLQMPKEPTYTDPPEQIRKWLQMPKEPTYTDPPEQMRKWMEEFQRSKKIGPMMD